jgi:hypothetical protein
MEIWEEKRGGLGRKWGVIGIFVVVRYLMVLVGVEVLG